jgi:hypothetical protein
MCFIQSGTSRLCPRATVRGLFTFSRLNVRVAAFIDGFNLYHALESRKLHHCKWVDLVKLCRVYDRIGATKKLLRRGSVQ